MMLVSAGVSQGGGGWFECELALEFRKKTTSIIAMCLPSRQNTSGAAPATWRKHILSNHRKCLPSQDSRFVSRYVAVVVGGSTALSLPSMEVRPVQLVLCCERECWMRFVVHGVCYICCVWTAMCPFPVPFSLFIVYRTHLLLRRLFLVSPCLLPSFCVLCCCTTPNHPTPRQPNQNPNYHHPSESTS